MAEIIDGGLYMSTVKVGSKGQIVIPQAVREMFDIKPGTALLIMADEKRGIALQTLKYSNELADMIFASGKNNGERIMAETIKEVSKDADGEANEE